MTTSESHLKALEGTCRFPRQNSEVCLNCSCSLEKKEPQGKYIHTNEHGKFCSEFCMQDFEQSFP